MCNMGAIKQNLRKDIKQRLLLLSKEYKVESDRGIFDNIFSMDEYKNASTIFLFVGTHNEINTSVIIERALNDGKVVGVPKCVKLGLMNVHQVRSLEELTEGKYGIKEPKSTAKIINPEEIDLAFIPCLSCNEKGHRLGYGGGFYDKYLKNTNFTKAVLCRKELMYEDIPTGIYDVSMDIVINEHKIIRL